jgi:hypothetical protein
MSSAPSVFPAPEGAERLMRSFADARFAGLRFIELLPPFPLEPRMT